MKGKPLLAVMTATLGFASACPAQSQDLASQIVGVWKYVSVNNKEVATGKMTYPLGEKPNGYIVYTKGVNWSRLSEQQFRVDKWSLCRG